LPLHVPNKYRIRTGLISTDDSYGNNGGFTPPLKSGAPVTVIASNGLGWEHVSVSLKDRCPTWEEMCEIKELFFDKEDTVMQLHPPKSKYVNVHNYCLHLWRPLEEKIPLPRQYMV